MKLVERCIDAVIVKLFELLSDNQKDLIEQFANERRVCIEEIKLQKRRDNNAALSVAAMDGNLLEVKKLLPVSDPMNENSQALQWAAEKGHLEIVKLLIPVSNPKAENSIALGWAAKNGHLDVVELLISVTNPKADHSRALKLAAENGHLDVVKALLPYSNPKDDGCFALTYATINSHVEIVELLSDKIGFANKRCKYALKYALDNNDKECARLLIRYVDIGMTRLLLDAKNEELFDELVAEMDSTKFKTFETMKRHNTTTDEMMAQFTRI